MESMAWLGTLDGWVAGLGTLAAVLYVMLQDKWKRPTLLLTFDNDREVVTQTKTIDPKHPGKSRWLRLRVTASESRVLGLWGGSEAKGCRAYLVGLQRVEPGGKTTNIFIDDARPMIWRHEPTEMPAARDLLPGVPQWVDIAATFEGDADAETLPPLSVRAYPSCDIPMPGDYIFTVQVSAENAAAKTIKLKVSWDHIYSTLSGEQVS